MDHRPHITPQTRPENRSGRPSGDGPAVALWLIAIVLAQYLFICWAIVHAYSG
jgi:hypothetical protein